VSEFLVHHQAGGLGFVPQKTEEAADFRLGLGQPPIKVIIAPAIQLQSTFTAV
jgi:hypothetical protein